ncbi:hypothetical protein C8R43DRAFT_944127 [Mycena crocata]|nr:hypothetical protein C8R43DRAFT_944127 [Mycena crocata]
MPSKDICGVRVKAFSRAPPGPTREPDQDFTSSVLGPTITLNITARGPFIEKEWRRTNFVTFLRLIFERVGTIDIAWEWLCDSYLQQHCNPVLEITLNLTLKMATLIKP